jgi:hypothetical protein
VMARSMASESASGWVAGSGRGMLDEFDSQRIANGG